MLLFISAFCGNATYVVSIMTNPLVKTDPTFLPEAVPFLLGSGGTLAFDITILLQSFVYSGRRRKHRHRHRHRKSAILFQQEHGAEEARGLLHDSEHGSTTQPSTRAHSRTTSANSAYAHHADEVEVSFLLAATEVPVLDCQV